MWKNRRVAAKGKKKNFERIVFMDLILSYA